MKEDQEDVLLCARCATQEEALARWRSRRHPGMYLFLCLLSLVGAGFSASRAQLPSVLVAGHQTAAACLLVSALMFFGMWAYGVEKDE